MKWFTMINDYNQVMKVLCEKELKYVDNEIKTFQFKINSFSNVIMAMYSKRIFTNYIYDLISGYIIEYMKEWGYLYRYS